jgi:hypothetical protein
MGTCLVDNKAGILSNEMSVLEVFKERIERALAKHEQVSFQGNFSHAKIYYL